MEKLVEERGRGGDITTIAKQQIIPSIGNAKL
jgi:hypothetical protein